MVFREVGSRLNDEPVFDNRLSASRDSRLNFNRSIFVSSEVSGNITLNGRRRGRLGNRPCLDSAISVGGSQRRNLVSLDLLNVEVSDEVGANSRDRKSTAGNGDGKTAL